MLDEEDVSMVYLLGGGEEYNYLPRYRAYLQYLDLREVNLLRIPRALALSCYIWEQTSHAGRLSRHCCSDFGD